MKKPSFFILGAPKCGTTSMHEWLEEHPNIYLAPKEVHYYNDDHRFDYRAKNYEEYLSLFDKANENHKVIGESSVWYLYSDVAVDNILKDQEDYKFLVMLRNPMEMVQSLHKQEVFELNETEKDFKKAWKLQEERRNNKKIGITTKNSQYLVYGEVCKLGKQVERLFSKVDKNKVKIILLDDIKKDTLSVYKEILEFLEVDYDGKVNFETVNVATKRRSTFIAVIVKLVRKLRYKLGIKRAFGILKWIDNKNLQKIQKDTLDPAFQNEIKEHFKDDIKLLEKLIDRDLSNWL